MKKTFGILAKTVIIALLFLGIASCSSDDSRSGTKVRYALHTTADMTTEISFRGKSGNVVYVNLQNISTDWAKTINVTPPFNASVAATFENDTDAIQTYTLSIFVDEELAETFTGTVSPDGTGAHSILEQIGQ